MKLKNIGIVTLNWNEFSDEAFQSFKESLKTFGLYMGDLLDDYSKRGNGSDTYCLYIAKRKLTPKEIRETFGLELGLDDDQPTLFDMNEYIE